MAWSMGLMGASLPVAAGSFDLLETQVLASSAASVTFSSLSTYAADYQHLQLRMVTRVDADGGSILGQFNLDTGANYSTHRLFGNGSSVTSDAFTSTTYFFAGANEVSGATANAFNGNVTDILDAFSSSKYTTTRTFRGPSGNFVALMSGSWRNTNALTSIKLTPNVGIFITGSRFSLYGIRGG